VSERFDKSQRLGYSTRLPANRSVGPCQPGADDLCPITMPLARFRPTSAIKPIGSDITPYATDGAVPPSRLGRWGQRIAWPYIAGEERLDLGAGLSIGVLFPARHAPVSATSREWG
jgi:hypothetical protein